MVVESDLAEEVLIQQEEEELSEELQLLLVLVENVVVCKVLNMPLISGHLISFFSSLRLLFEDCEEDSFIESLSSLAVEVDEILRLGSSSI